MTLPTGGLVTLQIVSPSVIVETFEILNLSVWKLKTFDYPNDLERESPPKRLI